MTLWQMSVSGAAMIAAIVMLRALFLNKLPKQTFLILWEITLICLLVPFRIPLPFGIYAMMESGIELTDVPEINLNVIPITPEGCVKTNDAPVPIWLIVWGIGAMVCAAFFAIAYFRCRREFRMSLPVADDYIEQWLKTHKLGRKIVIRRYSGISTPLTYGIFHPVILFPAKTDWENREQLQYVLLHEYMHICHFDMVIKVISVSALCIHWFNPVVWVMHILLNRDIELTCDERVLRRLGENARSAYATTLINMEQEKSGLTPLCNNFGKNAIEERITAIMKMKRTWITDKQEQQWKKRIQLYCHMWKMARHITAWMEGHS